MLQLKYRQLLKGSLGVFHLGKHDVAMSQNEGARGLDRWLIMHAKGRVGESRFYLQYKWQVCSFLSRFHDALSR